MKNQKNHLSLFSLLSLASFASVGAILPTPLLPKIASCFSISVKRSALILVIYLIGYAVGQLLYGPLANHFGRKKSLYFGIVIAVTGSVLSIIAVNLHIFWMLIIARFLLAIGAAAGLIISMILIKDVNDAINARKKFAKITLSFALVPFITIAISGALAHFFGWQAINYFMAVYALLLLLIATKISETLSVNNQCLFSFNQLMLTYKKLLGNKTYLRLIILFSIGGTISYIFNALAPIIEINTLHISTFLYSWLSFIPSLGILCGAWLSNHFAHKFTANKMISCGSVLILSGAGLLGIFFYYHVINSLVIYSISPFIFCGAALLIPNTSMQALSNVDDYANGASIMNATALIASSISVNLASEFISTSPLAMPVTLTVIGLLAVILSSSEIKFLKRNKVLLFSS